MDSDGDLNDYFGSRFQKKLTSPIVISYESKCSEFLTSNKEAKKRQLVLIERTYTVTDPTANNILFLNGFS